MEVKANEKTCPISSLILLHSLDLNVFIAHGFITELSKEHFSDSTPPT